jgi:monofunctional biosynthetic peptidoglycan transglycosylase
MPRRILRVLAWLLLPVVAYWLLGLLLYRFVMPGVTPLMLIRSAERGAMVWQEGVRLDRVAFALRASVVAAEDSNFCLHAGVDLHAAKDALDDYRASGRLRGASTITMQVARNLFLWPGGGVVRKALEIPLALAVDALWPKQRILEVYLAIAEMGPGLFGAEAAARAYFGVPASRLGAQQSALLAAVLPSPNRWSAAEPGAYVRARARAIEAEAQRLSPAQAACLRAD